MLTSYIAAVWRTEARSRKVGVRRGVALGVPSVPFICSTFFCQIPHKDIAYQTQGMQYITLNVHDCAECTMYGEAHPDSDHCAIFLHIGLVG